ncbi:MAG: glutamate--tRNA ligase [Gammaproteobacteria bacterium]|nr:glutamate--tRNA ligase [Gammaproteobacteria bacterium]MDH3413248.1 glutamate--tRNA ligase [Gammaproteobacteria bacterium]
MTVRTRFAPSPTGLLHVGGARTALFCWLYARHCGGSFILRIEDTDRERSTEASVNAILDGMAWLGLDYDEGPFYQTQRMALYQQQIDRLLKEGNAYHCYCTRERIDALREQQRSGGIKPRYDGHCRDLSAPPAGAPAPAVRFKNPQDGAVVVDDLIRGPMAFSNTELDDLVIARPDGTPTYNFTVVVDDLDMQITHVIRGDDHINNTPRQLNIIRALGGTPPHYAHVPMILGSDGQRLSKRHGAVSVLQFRDDGFLPEALLNYLVRLGWSHGDQEIFELSELIKLFDIADVNKAASVFDFDKLMWLNQHYIKQADASRIAAEIGRHMAQLGLDPQAGPDLEDVVNVQRERARTLAEMAEKSAFAFRDFDSYEQTAAKKHLKQAAVEPLLSVRQRLEALSEWTPEAIHQAVLAAAESADVKLGKLAQPLRVAVTGTAMSPSIDQTLWLVGKSRTLARIDAAIAYIERAEASA